MGNFKKPDKVVVLILSYNGRHLLDDSVSSYLSNDYENFKVVVIDNGSVDGTRDYVEKKWPEVQVLRTEKNLGYSGGFNLGLKYAFKKEHADYALITNNDVKADRHVIKELVKVANQDTQIGFVTGKVYYYDHPDILQTVGKKDHPIYWNGGHIGSREKDTGQFDQVTDRPFADDIFMLVRRQVYMQIGGYDETYFLQCEEYDWQARAKKIGYKIFYTPYAKIWHKESMTIGKKSFVKAFYNARNPILVILNNRDVKFFKRFLWQHFRYRIVKSSLKSLITGRVHIALAMWLGFLSAIKWGVVNKKLTMKHIA